MATSSLDNLGDILLDEVLNDTAVHGADKSEQMQSFQMVYVSW